MTLRRKSCETGKRALPIHVGCCYDSFTLVSCYVENPPWHGTILFAFAMTKQSFVDEVEVACVGLEEICSGLREEQKRTRSLFLISLRIFIGWWEKIFVNIY